MNLTELRVGSRDTLTTEMAVLLLNPNIRKLSLDLYKYEDAAFMRIAEVCGPNLRSFRLHTAVPVPAANWTQFFQGCPLLCQLVMKSIEGYIDVNLNLPTLVELGEILPPALESLLYQGTYCSSHADSIRDFCLARIYLGNRNLRW